MQIASKLHRQQLVRAMKRVILGLGAVPGMPQDLRCMLVCASLRLSCPSNCVNAGRRASSQLLTGDGFAK